MNFHSFESISSLKEELQDTYKDWMHPQNRYGNPKRLVDSILRQVITDRVDAVIFNPEQE